MKSVLLASVVALLFVSSADAQLLGRRNRAPVSQANVTRQDVTNLIMANQVQLNTMAIQSNTDRIWRLEKLVLENKLRSLIDARIQASQQPAMQPTTIVEIPTAQPVYHRIETLPPVRKYVPVQPTHRVQQVRYVR